MLASPFSKSLPTILSPSMNKPNTLHTKFVLPVMVQTTSVWPPWDLNVNSVMFVVLNGRRNSRLMRINSGDWLSRMVMRPAPTLLLPSHANPASLPAGAPEKVFLHAGSILAHGDHASHL